MIVMNFGMNLFPTSIFLVREIGLAQALQKRLGAETDVDLPPKWSLTEGSVPVRKLEVLTEICPGVSVLKGPKTGYNDTVFSDRGLEFNSSASRLKEVGAI